MDKGDAWAFKIHLLHCGIGWGNAHSLTGPTEDIADGYFGHAVWRCLGCALSERQDVRLQPRTSLREDLADPTLRDA